MNTATSTDPAIVAAARWFWWIAGFSLLNTVLLHSGSDTNFVIGLGTTTLASVFLADSQALEFAFIALMLGFYFVIGLQAQRGQAWAFIVGLVVYTFDALIFVYFEDWMPVAFHALAIFFILRGAARLREFSRTPG